MPPEEPAVPLSRGVIEASMGMRLRGTLFAKARHKAIYGGRGSGKSWAVATYLATVTSQSRKRVVCARQYQNSIRDSSKELIEKRINDMSLNDQFSVTDRYIFHNTNKSQFLFMGLERNVESIRSLEGADIVWIEEARTISAKSMEVLLPTIRQAGSQLIWTWNPVDPEDPVDAYFRNGPAPPNSIITKVDYTDNPYFLKTEMPNEMQLLKKGNPARYRHVWLGEYDLRHESKVFPNTKIGRLDVPKNCAPLYGMDFGFAKDPSAVVKLYVIEATRQIYICGEAVGAVSLERLPSLVRSVVHSDDNLVRCDSSRPEAIEMLQGRGINAQKARKGPGSLKSGILFLQGYDIWIDPACEHMREEARLYSWMTDRLSGKILNTPVDANNHLWDAVRYAVEDNVTQPSADEDIGSGVLKLKLW